MLVYQGVIRHLKMGVLRLNELPGHLSSIAFSARYGPQRGPGPKHYAR